MAEKLARSNIYRYFCSMNTLSDFEARAGAAALTLPAYAIARTVNEVLARESRLVVTAPPGAGKSTLLPLTMLFGWMDAAPFPAESLPQRTHPQGLPPFLGGRGERPKIIMLEPRRLAARAVAERMAELLGEPVGQTVGYRVRFESRVTAATRIEVVTEGILTHMLTDDATLEGVACVIFDEFHERSIHSDVALALAREAQEVIRPDLRIVVMSATIDASAICCALGTEGNPAPLVESEGRLFPVAIHHASETATADDCAERVAGAIREAVVKHEGDVLAFLPGEGEIRRCGEILDRTLPGCITPFSEAPSAHTDTPPIGGRWRGAPLYGNLSLAEQRRAIAPSPEGERKIVLATNIAETSLTIEGVRIIVDSGLCRQMVYDAQSGLSRLETVRISLDMAAQRSGRAGRVAEGVCLRLWTMATEHRIAEHRTAEILTADLAPMLLDVAAWGESRVERLPWITPPPMAAVREARRLLVSLKALDADGAITPHGRHLAKLPCNPRVAQMLLSAHSPEEKALAADIAALLEERDPMAGAEADADICSRIEVVSQNRHRYQRIARIAEQYRRLITAPSPTCGGSLPFGEGGGRCLVGRGSVGRLIAAAYPERVAKAHADGCGRFVTAGGEIIRVDQNDLLSAYEWLAVASFNAASGRIFLAAPLDVKDLAPLIYVKDNLSWDAKQNRLIARREERVGGLVVKSRPLDDVSRDDALAVICDAARRRGESMLDFAADAVVALQHRVAAVRVWRPEMNFPDLSTSAVLERVEEWLPFYVERPTDDLKRLDLAAALMSLLDYEQQQALERLAPTHIQVPTGSRICLEYRLVGDVLPQEPPPHGGGRGERLQPVLRVRLQECFGMEDTPRVDDGRQPVLMELLSPGFKPVQLTQDLHSFWTTTYFDVRKELRRRYPKHHWPDNPLAADPVRGVKRKQ